MGRVREFTEEDNNTSSISEALLFTTMCIVGLPVEVHIKDGSIFSGIFHTASVQKGYGIALKKAKLVKKGTQNANVGNGRLIDTLVVLPGDLIQVVAKGVMLPFDTASSDATSYDEEALLETADSPPGSQNGAILAVEQLNCERQVGLCRSGKEEDNCHVAPEAVKEVIEIMRSTATLNGSCTKQIVHQENQATVPNLLTYGSLVPNGVSHAVKVVNQLPSAEYVRPNAVASEVPPSKIALAPLANRTAKGNVQESKLNPGAKVFSPSLTHFRSTPSPAPAVANVAYAPNNFPSVQVAVSQPEVGIRLLDSHSSWPVKLVPYVTSPTAIADNCLQYSQPIAAHLATRTQPVRHGGQYQPVQAGLPYVHANHQNGMFGRPGQLVYVHPVTHDVIQAPGGLSQTPHSFLTSHPIPVGKHEGVVAGQALQVSVTPPLIATGPQPFMIPSHVQPSHIQISQPLFSSMRSVQISGPNPYNAKFH